MFNISRGLLLFLFISLHFISKAQDRSNYALLWEIKSPSSDKISYLFGTAHLKDPRVFDFSDAMIPAIAQSEAFALEVHPDSVTGAISEYLIKTENSGLYRDVLTKEEYGKLNTRVIAETGKPLDSLEYNSLYHLESLLRPELDKIDDKETFLDAYLYGVAHTMDKQIYGLEKLKDQMPDLDSIPTDELRNSLLNLIEMDEEKYREGVANLIDVYTTGNIDRILLMSQGMFTIDKVMISRNQVMAKSMKRIMDTQSLFAAVGAAHLPGEYGIINLLRKDGYIVTKVKSPFTAASNNFVVKPNIKKWKSYEDDSLGYKIMLPGVSQRMPIKEGFAMKVQQDLISGVSFFHVPMDLRSKSVEDMKIITETVISRFTSTVETTNVTSAIVERNGKKIYQVIKKNPSNDNFTRIEIVAVKGVLYTFGAEYTESETATATVDAYFDSIVITEAVPLKIPDVEWKPFDSPEGGFIVDLPGEVRDISRESPNPQEPEGEPYTLNLFMAQDLKNDYNYLVRYNNFPLGYYLENENAIADEFASSLINQGQGSTLISKKKITYKGMHGYDLEIKIQNKYNSKLRYLTRGNKTYLLLAQKINETDTASFDNPVFNSFEIQDFKPAIYQTITNDDNAYSFLFPKKSGNELTPINEYNSEYKQSIDYFGLEENSGDVFLVSEVSLKPYFKIKSKEEFYDKYVDLIKNYGDSIYKQESFRYEGIEAKDYYLKNKKTTIVQKYRFVFIGDKVVTLSTYQPLDQIDGERSNSIMDGLKLLKPKKFDVHASKSKAIIKALRSKDTTLYKEAVGALDYYTFEAEDEKLLQKSLYLDLPNDSLYWGAKNLIIYSLGSLRLNSSIDKLKEFYLSDKSSNFNKLMTFQGLSEIKTPESMNVYVDLLLDHPPKITKNNDGDILGYSLDSLLTLPKHGLDILKIQENDELRSLTISYFNRQLRKDTLNALPFVRKHTNHFLKYFEKDATHYLDTTATHMSKVDLFTLSNYINIIDTLAINNPSVLALTKRLFQDQKEVNHLSLKSFTYFINHAESLDKEEILSFIKPQYYRFEGIQALLEAGKDELIPPSYLSSKAIAEISLYNAVGYDDGYPDTISFKDNYTQDGLVYKAFIYTFDSEDKVGKEYLGLVLDEEFSRESPAQFSVFYQYDELSEGDWKLLAKQIIDSYN